MLTPLKNIDDWNKLKESQNSFYIFKHSNSCPTSAAAKERLLKALPTLKTNVYEVVVQDDRELSDLIADEMKVKHESPQLIKISEGQVESQCSHDAIFPQV